MLDIVTFPKLVVTVRKLLSIVHLQKENTELWFHEKFFIYSPFHFTLGNISRSIDLSNLSMDVPYLLPDIVYKRIYLFIWIINHFKNTMTITFTHGTERLSRNESDFLFVYFCLLFVVDLWLFLLTSTIIQYFIGRYIHVIKMN